jgi:hypothetical protein
VDLNSSASTIRDRFLREKRFIERFVEFLQVRARVTDAEIMKLQERLMKFDFEPLTLRLSWTNPHRVWTSAAVTELLPKIEEIRPRLKQVIAEQSQLAKAIGRPEYPEEFERKADTLGMISALAHYSEATAAAAHEFAKANWSTWAYGTSEPFDPDVVDYALQAGRYIRAAHRLTELCEISARLDEIEVAHRMTSDDAEINMLRQGFILLMTAFDAAMFDLVRVALQFNFFGLFPTFSRQKTVPIEHFSKSHEFEGFRDGLIDEQLKSLYIRDLLHTLRKLGVHYLDGSTKLSYGHVMELVARRNVHMHNRGIVDARYMDCDEKGEPRYNVYSLKLGQVAVIDEPYFRQASTLVDMCVDRTAKWVSDQVTS